MKKIVNVSVSLFLTCLLLTCKNDNGPIKKVAEQVDHTGTLNPPEPHHLSIERWQRKVDKEIEEALLLSSDSLIEEADGMVTETNDAIRYLLVKKYPDAAKCIEGGIGKSNAITTIKPSIVMIPLGIHVSIQDLTTDMETLDWIKAEAASLLKRGYVQSALQLLNRLKSEITIRTSRLPLATYPGALKFAASLTKEKKFLDAMLALNTALNSIVIEERAVPLPLMRAELFLEEANILFLSGERKEKEIAVLLSNADYQIRFAEALGYGKKDKEFEEFYAAIRDLENEMKKKNGSGQMQEKSNTLRDKLRKFRLKISRKEIKK